MGIRAGKLYGCTIPLPKRYLAYRRWLIEEPAPMSESVAATPLSDDQHKQGIISLVAARIVAQMDFRNILAILMVVTMCYKELRAFEVSDNFYLLVGMIIGMYFKQATKE